MFRENHGKLGSFPVAGIQWINDVRDSVSMRMLTLDREMKIPSVLIIS